MHINSSFKILGKLDNVTPAESLKNTTMLHQCSWGKAFDHTEKDAIQPLQSLFLNLPLSWQEADVLIDTRVHMLMPGWYPCVPGWHHDAVPRTRPDGQPNYAEDQMRAEHVLMILGDDIAGTEFIEGDFELTDPEKLSGVYACWHREVSQQIKESWSVGTVEQAKPGEIILFNDRTFHQGVPATGTGWRYFVRVSRFFNPDGTPTKVPAKNEVRHQSQIYTPQPFAGW